MAITGGGVGKVLQVKSNTAAGRAVRKQARDKKSSNLIGSGSNQYPNVCLSVEYVFAYLLYTNVVQIEQSFRIKNQTFKFHFSCSHFVLMLDDIRLVEWSGVALQKTLIFIRVFLKMKNPFL